MTKPTRSEKWDKEDKLPWHVMEFPGTKKAIWRLLYILDFIPDDDAVTIEQWYVNPTYHVALTRDKKIKVYMDGNLVDPKEDLKNP